jgi:hypothetical protein
LDSTRSGLLSGVSFTFREGFIGGALLAAGIGIYLVWLWRPAHQVELHADHFLHAVEKRDWTTMQNAIAADYGDDWNDNRERVLERMREVLQFTRNLRLQSIAPDTSVAGPSGSWIARIEVEGDEGEVVAEIKQRINSLTTPFNLQWRRQSAKPWDWKLVHVSNRELQIPPDD